MFKRVLCSLLIVAAFITAVPCVSWAALPNTISLSQTGNATDIIYIKRPESHQASTSDKTYTISAVGEMGTKIKIYKYNPKTDTCSVIKNETSIGASGLFSVVVDLPDDSNIFVVAGENQKGMQAVRIDINKIKRSTVERLKSLTVTIRNIFW